MKNMILSVVLLLGSSSAYATVDAHDKVYLVVQNIQSEEFFVERAPIIGCYGLPRGPQLAQLTAEYKVTSNIGCGGDVFQDNINYLTCAKVVSSKESGDFSGFSEITLDISKCDAKNNSEFLSVLHKVVRLNFPLKKGEVKLNLIK